MKVIRISNILPSFGHLFLHVPHFLLVSCTEPSDCNSVGHQYVPAKSLSVHPSNVSSLYVNGKMHLVFGSGFEIELSGNVWQPEACKKYPTLSVISKNLSLSETRFTLS